MGKSNNNQSGISLVINTKDEEKNIVDCINSAKSIVDEIIVVDMESTDKTVQLAKKMGAKVYSVENYGYVEPARNFAIKKAKNTWVLVLDADERLHKSLEKTILEIVNSNKYDLVSMPRKNIIFNKWVQHTGWWPDYQIRLFKKDHLLYWPRTIHSQPKIKGKLLKLEPKVENAMIHLHIFNVNGMLDMINRYSYIESRIKRKEITSAGYLINYVRGEFIDRFFHLNGYKDGFHGYALSKFMEFYRFLEMVRRWEKKNYKSKITVQDFYKTYNEAYFENPKTIQMQQELTIIKSSIFYNLWRIYNRTKKYLFAIFTFLNIPIE